mmetsp:Transcript_11023/g.34802  ORF Transcript_11023/g.34802 Transcript_11023/m.34802 type:complete len:96 (-) Transcript_11023:676-963(-)
MACERTRVAVEFDGPTHYVVDLTTGEESYDGSSRWKSRVLEALGWRVYRVGWREWAGQPVDGRRRSREEIVASLAASVVESSQSGDDERLLRLGT